MDRTIKQLGQGFTNGNGPAEITARINGVVVHDGPIFTVDYDIHRHPAWPMLSDPVTTSELFSWQVDTHFVGEQCLEISVKHGRVLLTDTVANYVGSIDNPHAPPMRYPENPRDFGVFTQYCVDGLYIMDPLTQIYINDELQEIDRRGVQGGQWWWTVNQGSNFRCTVTIQQAQIIHDWSPTVAYGNHSWVRHQGQLYFSIFDMEPGTALTDKRNWTTVPLPDWNQTQSYEQYSRVRHQDQGGFRALKDVPVGISLNNTEYWHEWNPAPILEWHADKTYTPPDRARWGDEENLVKGYRCLKPVPMGIHITNTEYWQSCTETECFCAEEEF